MAHVQRCSGFRTPQHEQHGCRSTAALDLASNLSTHHVEGTLVVILLHELDGALVLANMLSEHHILHSPLIIRHISPPKSVLALLRG